MSDDGLTQERLTEALKAHVDATGGLMVGDKFTVDGYTVTVGEGSTVRITLPPIPSRCDPT